MTWLCLSISLLTIATPAKDAWAGSPDFLWARQGGGGGEDVGASVAVDSVGNSFVVGWFNGNAGFGDRTLIGRGSDDAFLAAYSSGGSLLWIQQAGGAATDRAIGLALDGDGNCYVTGFFQGQADFGSITLTSQGAEDVFLAKYDPQGEVLWVQHAGGGPRAYGCSAAVDQAGCCYVGGYFGGSATFGDTTFTSQGNIDVFVAKYDPAGHLLWVRQGPAAGSEGNMCGIALDAAGNSYITGWFSGTVSFGETSLTSLRSDGIFLAKYDAAGNLLRAQQVGTGDHAHAIAVAADPAGNCWLTGGFWGTAVFGPTTLAGWGTYDVFVAKYDSSGDLLWVSQAGSDYSDSGCGIAVDGAGNSYIAGAFWSNARFGDTTLATRGGSDAFLAAYDFAGHLRWVRQAGGGSGDQANSVAVDASGNCYVAGLFSSTAGFGNVSLNSQGGYDMFVTKLGGPPVGPTISNVRVSEPPAMA